MTNWTGVVARPRRWLIAGFVAVAALGLWSSPASAHTAFDSSDPADQTTVDGPLATVTVNFTNAAVESGDGFQVLGPDGVVRVPTAVDPTDGTAFVLSFDPALTAGAYGVRWQVQAGDAHPIDGSFQFTITPASPTTPTVTASVIPPTTVPPPTTAVAAAPVPVTSTTVAAAVAADATPTTSVGVAEPSSLDAFLDSERPGDQAFAGRMGRGFTMAGTVVGVGALAALWWVIRGRREELVTVATWVRLSGLMIATGGVIEFATLDEISSSGFGELMATRPGAATALKVVGGVLIWTGFTNAAGHVRVPARALSSAVATDPMTAREESRWHPTPLSAIGMGGLALAMVSFTFDGHTVSKGPGPIHAIVNLVHVGAASVWVGGVLAMTAIVVLRRRHAERTGVAAMVVRFSAPAAISLAALAAAGLVMAWFILDRPGDLFATEWGRVLLAKTAAVAVAAGMGAYNHLQLRPALERTPDDPALLHELRRSLLAESAVMVVIIGLTAWLAGAAS